MAGFACLPTLSRANSLGQYLFVNRRPVRDRLLLGAVRAAYSDHLGRDRHPVLALDPFRRPRGLYHACRATKIMGSLMDRRAMASRAPSLRIEQTIVEREESGSSAMGDFMQRDPKFESDGQSGSSDSELANLTLPAPPVTLLWRELTVVSSRMQQAPLLACCISVCITLAARSIVSEV